jgi:hypothetical protein
MKYVRATLCLMCMFTFVVVAESGTLRSQILRIGAAVDYTWSSMADVNKQLDKGDNVKKMGSGILGVVDVNIILAPFLMTGVRAVYLLCMPASVQYNYVLYNQATTLHASLLYT